MQGNEDKGETSETVAEFFFADENGELPGSIDLSEVNMIYIDYIRVMTIMHEKLKNTYNSFVTRFLNEDQRKQNNLQPEAGRFQQPGII